MYLEVIPRLLLSQLIKILYDQEFEVFGFPLGSTMSHVK